MYFKKILPYRQTVFVNVFLCLNVAQCALVEIYMNILTCRRIRHVLPESQQICNRLYEATCQFTLLVILVILVSL